MVLPAPSVVSAHSRASSMPASPVTPVTKRSSSGSTYGHKKNKASVDKPPSERMSFFNVNRQRKPPPREDDVNLEKNKSLSRLGFSSSARASKTSTPASSPVVPSGPSPQRLSVTPAESVVDKIGKPDFAGYMKKKGERYNTWKLRYFVLRGPNLYYMRSEHEHRIKGHIDLTGHRVVVDENVHPGNYGFRVVGGAGEKEHAFSSSEQSTVREWMKALIKATIARDYSAPVVSSCNIPTIPLDEAQAMSPAPRPPSPTQRDATQRASRRENVNQLTPRDASVLMSLDGGLDSGHKRRVSGLGVPAAPPPRPSRELRRPSRPSVSVSRLTRWCHADETDCIRVRARGATGARAAAVGQRQPPAVCARDGVPRFVYKRSRDHAAGGTAIGRQRDDAGRRVRSNVKRRAERGRTVRDDGHADRPRVRYRRGEPRGRARGGQGGDRTASWQSARL